MMDWMGGLVKGTGECSFVTLSPSLRACVFHFHFDFLFPFVSVCENTRMLSAVLFLLVFLDLRFEKRG